MQNEAELPSTSPDPLAIDMTHWRLEDKTFQSERKANWPIVEEILTICFHKTKKFINVVKKYYLKGELPDWVALNNADNSSTLYYGHLDIATFLWLHPSHDEKTLAPLAKAYCAGHGRLPNDIQVGVRFLFEWGMSPANMRRADWQAKCSCFQGKARLLFNLIYGCLEGGKLHMEVKGLWRTDVVHEIQHPNWSHFMQSTDWLCQKKLGPYQDEMIFQHEEVLHLVFQVVNNNPDDALYWFNTTPDQPARALYRIANFDVKKEGNTLRTHYVNSVRKILDEGVHVPAIKDLWIRLQNDEVEVKTPWKT